MRTRLGSNPDYQLNLSCAALKVLEKYEKLKCEGKELVGNLVCGYVYDYSGFRA